MLVSAKEMLEKAKAGHYAVGQFNINNLEWTKAILLTAQENNSPVILGVSEGAGKYMAGYKTIVGMVNGMLSLCAVYWTTYAKLSRSLVLQMKDADYIRAAKLCGAKNRHIIFRYVLPNVVSPLVVTAALDVGSVILSMAGLSFLGLGAQRPTAEWGVMMSEARNYMQTAPWIIIFPGLALFLTVIVFNRLGDSVRDVLNKRSLQDKRS